MHSSIEFAYKKSTQAINFFATKNNGSIDKLKALKLIYFADKYHLRKYGRLITNDMYYAMPLGPVASSTKEIFELGSLNEEENAYAVTFFEPVGNTYYIRSVRKVDKTELSETELEALNFVAENYLKMDSIKLSNLTHKYPDWKKKEKSLKSGNSRVGMDVMDFFDDPEEPEVDKLFELEPEEKEAKKEHLAELYSLEELWEK